MSTWETDRTGGSTATKARIQSIPLSPATAARQVSGAVFPTGVIDPSPVTATRRTRGRLCFRGAAEEASVPADGGRARRGAAAGGGLAVRGEVGRLPRRAREPR